jgi:STE24 endopeptidase
MNLDHRGMNNWNNLFLSLLVIKFIMTIYLNLRNQKHIKNAFAAIPHRFEVFLTLEEHQKACLYTNEKLRFSLINTALSIIVMLFWTMGHGLEYLTTWTQTHTPFINNELTGLYFFALFAGINFVIDLPISIYSTFVLEEKYGFNKTTVKTFIGDIIKATILAAIIGGPLLYAILWIMKSFPLWWPYAFVLFAIFQIVLFFAYPKWIAPLFNKFHLLENETLSLKIQTLMKKAELDFKEIFVMDASKRSSHGNAYFTGFGKNRRVVFFDTLLKNLDDDETIGVLAHELGHFKLKHIQWGIVKAFIILGFTFFIINVLSLSASFHQGHGLTTMTTYSTLLLFSMVLPIYSFFITPINSYFSRKNEFAADAFAAKNSKSEFLIRGLLKLYKNNSSCVVSDPWYSAFYYSHPPALERINALEGHHGSK